MLAVCPNNGEVWLYSGCKDPEPEKWKVVQVLKKHDLLVTGIDWHPISNKIVTCSQDRNAFVWSNESGEWTPTVVVVDINRAATAVKWSPDGKKFAVASSDKQTMVCWYDVASNWWISRALLKKSKSAVVALSWHPNSQVLATASTDYKCRVSWAHLADSDLEPDTSLFGSPDPLRFGDTIIDFEVPNKAWVNDVAWSPSGRQLGYVSHDGLLHIVTFALGGRELPVQQTVKTAGLPAMRLLWLSEQAIVTGGHNEKPDVFISPAGGSWAFAGSGEAKDASRPSVASTVDAAKSMFGARVGGVAKSSSASKGKHQSAITFIQPYTSAGGKVSAISSSGLDGKVIVWDLTKSDAAAALTY